MGERLVYRSSLVIRGWLICLPANNIWLVCDPWLQPGILSIKARDVPEKSNNNIVGHKGCGNLKYDNIHGSGGSGSVLANPPLRRPTDPLSSSLSSHDGEGGKRTKGSRDANLQHRRRSPVAANKAVCKRWECTMLPNFGWVKQKVWTM